MDDSIKIAFMTIGVFALFFCALAIPYLAFSSEHFSFVQLIGLTMGSLFGWFLIGVACEDQ